MLRLMLKSKVHRATVTEADLDYEGSLTLDQELMDAADLREFEGISVYNVTNGSRFETYVINGRRGSGTICINGAAAHLAGPGDLVIIASYTWLEEKEVLTRQPRIVLVDGKNRIKKIRDHFPAPEARGLDR
jgi:aspartate 1-decarboxylase